MFAGHPKIWKKNNKQKAATIDAVIYFYDNTHIQTPTHTHTHTYTHTYTHLSQTVHVSLPMEDVCRASTWLGVVGT